MKTIDRSSELRKSRDGSIIKIRELKNEIAEKRGNLVGLSPDSAAYFTIQEEIREREGKIYAERKNQNKCDRELYRALVEETEALAALNEKMTEELRPKVNAIIGEAEKAMADYAARIEALAGEYPGRPEHFGIIFNINVRKGSYDYAARDNALDFLLQPLRFVQYQKDVEAQNLFENNGRPEDWRN